MMTKITIALKANFIVDGNHVRLTRDWTALARANNMPKSRDAAKTHAGETGYAAMVWSNGHTALYVRDNESGDLIRIKFNGTAPTPEPQPRAEAPVGMENRG